MTAPLSKRLDLTQSDSDTDPKELDETPWRHLALHRKNEIDRLRKLVRVAMLVMVHAEIDFNDPDYTKKRREFLRKRFEGYEEELQEILQITNFF